MTFIGPEIRLQAPPTAIDVALRVTGDGETVVFHWNEALEQFDWPVSRWSRNFAVSTEGDLVGPVEPRFPRFAYETSRKSRLDYVGVMVTPGRRFPPFGLFQPAWDSRSTCGLPANTPTENASHWFRCQWRFEGSELRWFLGSSVEMWADSEHRGAYSVRVLQVVEVEPDTHLPVEAFRQIETMHGTGDIRVTQETITFRPVEQ